MLGNACAKFMIHQVFTHYVVPVQYDRAKTFNHINNAVTIAIMVNL